MNPQELLNMQIGGSLVKNPPVEAVVMRELKAEDLAELDKPVNVKPKALAKIRASHHQLARMLATGMAQCEISAVTGFCQSRISILKNDPSFAELMLHYQNTENEHHADVRTLLKNVSLDALGELRDRLHENAEDMSDGMLLKLTEMGLDRTGHGVQTNTSVTVAVLSADDLLEAKNGEHKSTIYSKAERLSDSQKPSTGRTFENGAGLETEET